MWNFKTCGNGYVLSHELRAKLNVLSFLLKLLGLTMVNKIIWDSDKQFYNISSV